METDPLLRGSRREAWLVVLLYLAVFVWTILYCSREAYGRPRESLRFVLGVPAWVFWGVLVPWAASFLASLVFVFREMKDEDLGEEP